MMVDDPAKNGSKCADPEKDAGPKRAERFTIALTAGLLLFSGVSALVYIFQYKTMNKTLDVYVLQHQAMTEQLDVMREQLKEMRDSSVQVDQSIAAFKKMADAMGEWSTAAKFGLRARIQIRLTDIENLNLDPSKIVANFSVKNVGLTSAFKVSYWGSLAVMENPLTAKVDFFDVAAKMEAPDHNTLIIQPGQDITHELKAEPSLTAEFKKLGNNRRFYRLIVVTYRDVYGAKYWSRSCTSSTSEAVREAAKNPKLALAGELCLEYNDGI